MPYWASTRTPSKFLAMMKLTTPPTAAAPYTAEAPPVRTSTRSIRAEGMKLMSAASEPPRVFGVPGIRRRPSIRTWVRVAPRPRRLTVAVPVEPLDRAAPWAAKACGRLLIMSSPRVTPVALISAALTAVTGLTLSRFGDGIRVPVTTTSEISSEAVWAAACDERPNRAAPQIIDDAKRRSRMDLNFTVLILQRSCPAGGRSPQKEIGPESGMRPRLRRSYGAARGLVNAD